MTKGARMLWRRGWIVGGLVAALAILAAACGGTKTVEVTRVVKEEVTKVVTKEVEKEVTKVVEVPVTVEVEKVADIPEIQLRCNSGWPAPEYMSVSMTLFTDVLKALSGGKITSENFYAGALWKAGETPDALGGGLADCGTMSMLYYRGTYSVAADGSSLPYAMTAEMAADMLNIPTVGEIVRKELAATNIVPVTGIPVLSGWFFRNELPHDIAPEDMSTAFDGLRVRGFGSWPDVIRLFGGAAVSFPSPEIPVALRQGQLDGFITSFGSWKNLAVQEDAPWAYDLQSQVGGALYVAMNKDTFDSFSPEVQELVLRAGDTASKLGLDNAVREAEKIKEDAKRNPKIHVVEATEEEVAKWREGVKPLWEDFAAKSAEHKAFLETLQKYLTEGYTPSWER